MKFITVLVIILFCNGCGGCGEGCARCGGISQICSTCKSGYWLYTNTCHRCPANCEECKDATLCSKCKESIWGTGYCDKQCPESCDGGGCDDETGHCFGCLPGFYGTSCLKNCTLCKDGRCDINECKNGCIDGYYEETANTVKTCRQCTDNCNVCQSQAICSECDEGFYLFSFKSTLNVTIALCYHCSPLCEECYAFSNCTLCKPGTYGPLCKYNCSESNCHRCNKDGDVEKCTECTTGYIVDGTSCVQEITCSKHCANGCDEKELCVYGCTDGWSGQSCTQKCASQCQRCQQDNNKVHVCTKCTEDFFTSSCNIPCNEHCSKGSPGETCRLQDGVCVNDCTDGYWGDTCNKTCYEGCNSTRCNQTNSFCATCLRNFYGGACQHTCSEHCFNDGSIHQICRTSDGKCEIGCISGYSGERCEYPTSSIIPSPPTSCNTGTEKCKCNSQLQKQASSEAKFYVLGIVTGVGLSLIVAAGFGLFCFLRRRQKFTTETTHTLETKEEKAYENTTIGMSALSATETDYERLQGDKRDDQQQYTELGRPERN